MKNSLILTYCFLSLAISTLSAQSDSSWQEKPSITIFGFLDTYYIYDFSRPQGNVRQDFLFNHNRHHEFNFNLALIKINVQSTKYRANLAWQSGTYVSDNYVQEASIIQNIHEANIGISLNNANTLWLDAGIMPSHIGVESAVSSENWTLTRSLAAENSPYFMAGAKLSYNPNDAWEISLLALNGWQRIQRVTGNSLLSAGSQLRYTPSKNLLLNWSTFVGTDDPDISRRIRVFNNFYSQFEITDRIGLIAGFDLGLQQNNDQTGLSQTWLSPLLIGRYQISDQWRLAARAEYYQDPNEVIVITDQQQGFETLGFSLNLDYQPVTSLFCRLEVRNLRSSTEIFESPSGISQNNIFVALSMAMQLSKSVY